MIFDFESPSPSIMCVLIIIAIPGQKVKFGSKKTIFGVIWGGFEGFGPCLGIRHPPTHVWENFPQKKRCFFWAASLIHLVKTKLIEQVSRELNMDKKILFKIFLNKKTSHPSIMLPSFAASTICK